MKLSSLLIAFFLFASFTSIAQEKTEKIKVNGECGMCKTKIEKAAKSAGASYALWDSEKKELTVTYNNTSSNNAKIEKAVAAVGYDTEHEKAADATYDKLHECCKYDRTAMKVKEGCCDQCTDKKGDCCKDGKCADCKEHKDGKKMDCCKDGKCEMHKDAAHDAKGASCCKKA